MYPISSVLTTALDPEEGTTWFASWEDHSLGLATYGRQQHYLIGSSLYAILWKMLVVLPSRSLLRRGKWKQGVGGGGRGVNPSCVFYLQSQQPGLGLNQVTSDSLLLKLLSLNPSTTLLTMVASASDTGSKSNRLPATCQFCSRH